LYIRSCLKMTLIIFVLSSFSVVANAADTLTGLGDLAGGSFSSNPYNVNSDGSVVVGESLSVNGNEAFRWTQASGMEGLGDLTGGSFYSIALGVNSDGSVIVGASSSLNGNEAFSWTQAGGMVGLGDLAGGAFYSFATAVNLDGSIIVGLGISASGGEAFRWTQAAGMVGLGDLAGGSFSSNPSAVNSDGSVIVGSSDGANGTEAFRWTQGGGMIGIGDLAGGGFYSNAKGVSSVGSVIVGQSYSTSGAEAFRWTQAGGMVGLGDLAGGGFNSIANAVNSDGSVIVGQGFSITGGEAFRWTQADGMIRIEDWLANAGVNTSGFSILTSASGVSADGSIVVGTGTSVNGTEAFLARVSSIGSGILDSVSTNKSAAETQNILGLGGISTSIVLNGAHHRPLIMDKNIIKKDGNKKACMWVTGDVGYLGSGRNGYITNEEVGLCTDTLDNQVRIGAGLGLSQSGQDMSFEGEQSLNGQYGLIEANYKPKGTDIIFSLTGVYGGFDAEIDRGYLNAGSNDISQGETDVKMASLRASAYWEEAVEIKTFKISPKFSYTASRIEKDGYTETGGGFPIRFDNQTTTTHEIRVGVDAKKELSTKTDIRLMLEGIHKPKSDKDVTSGDVIGLYSFDFKNESKAETWVRAGLDLDHRLESGITIGASLFRSSSGDVDPDIS